MTSPRAITALSGAAIAGGLGVAVKRDSTTTINRAVRKRIHPRRSPALRSVATGISYLADPHIHPFVAAALGLLITRMKREGGLAPIAASFGALAVDNGTRLLWTAVAALSISVGWSRLYLDEHWIDDVVGGWLAGIALGIGSTWACDH
jgi:hypothetical protein